MDKIKKEIEELRVKINYHSKKYYVDDSPEISDYDYDMMYRRLQDLERENPEYDDPLSPTKRVGGEALKKFDKVEHVVAMKSLQDVFSFEELGEFLSDAKEKLAKEAVKFVEEYRNKIEYVCDVKSDTYSSDSVPFADKGIPGLNFMRFGSADLHLSLKIFIP